MRTLALPLLCLYLNGSAQSAEPASRDAVLTQHAQAAAATLDSTQRAALAVINDENRRNLAMTFYLRAGSNIQTRWAWSEERIEAYRQSAESVAAQAEIAKISTRFANDNPGYVLYTNTEVRNLELQLQRWQTVRSVGVAAAELRAAMLVELQKVDGRSDASAKRFRAFLIRWRASHPITLAAPGLSLHGQGRAFDFQVRDTKGRTIAGTDSATSASVWRRQGWADKVERAIRAESTVFVGPLVRPDEPWHFEYRPAGALAN
ncbi:MAG TPA: hypothetical protein VK629_22200 [Steroidobacteraceae bacterium]|nr:hypothetical protein [Steroidobacteraceae bacterium]